MRRFADSQMEDIRRRRDEALERCRRDFQLTHPFNVYQTDSSIDEGAGEDTVDGLVVPPVTAQQTKQTVISSM